MDRRLRIDVVAALLVVGGFWVVPAVGDGRPWAGVLLGGAAGAAMVLRRRAPVVAVVVAAVVTAGGAVFGVGQDPMLAAAWCLYPVAAERADRARGLAVGVACGLAVLGATVAVPGGGPRVLVAGVVLGGAWLLGTAAGRQARAAEALERARVQAAVAREVHDVVGHALAVIAAEAGVTLALPGSGADELRQSLADVELQARGALQEVQTLVRNLRDLPTAVAPARDRLRAVLAASRAAGMTVRARIDGDLPEPGGTVVVRVVQESLSNALRHASGAVCRVDVRARGADLLVDVHSAGSPRDDPGTGTGLLGLRERVGMAGGELSWSAPDAGEFLVTARVPLRLERSA